MNQVVIQPLAFTITVICTEVTEWNIKEVHARMDRAYGLFDLERCAQHTTLYVLNMHT